MPAPTSGTDRRYTHFLSSAFPSPDVLARVVVLLLAAAALPAPARADTDVVDERPGIHFSAAYTADAIRNFDGGLRTGGTWIDNLDLQLVADRGSLFGIPGLSGLVYVLHNNSSEFSSEYVGDAHVVSNIDAPGAWRLYEIWLDWATGGDTAYSARVGLYDLNSEFDVIETGGLFVNSAMGIGTDFAQTGVNGPSIFPVAGLALRLRAAWQNGFYAQAAAIDGVPGDPDDPESSEVDLSDDEGALLVFETGYSAGAWRKLALGAWRYTEKFDRLAATTGGGDPVRSDGNDGFYAIADRTLIESERGTVAGFVRAGTADDRYNPFDGYFGTGLSLANFSAARPDDELGIGVVMGFNGSEYRRAQALDGITADHHETTVELTWRLPVADWLVLQPDIQYVINPGSDPALDNALIMGVRFEIGFERRLSGGG